MLQAALGLGAIWGCLSKPHIPAATWKCVCNPQGHIQPTHHFHPLQHRQKEDREDVRRERKKNPTEIILLPPDCPFPHKMSLLKLMSAHGLCPSELLFTEHNTEIPTPMDPPDVFLLIPSLPSQPSGEHICSLILPPHGNAALKCLYSKTRL